MTHTKDLGEEWNGVTKEEYEEALKNITGICEYCGQEYRKLYTRKKYCSSSCKSKRHYRDRRLSERQHKP